MKYRKKPLVIIEAFKFGVDYMPDWFMDKVTTNAVILHAEDKENPMSVDIETLEGTMRGNYGDYIIKGVYGELYPCKSDIFELTYEAVEE